MKQVLILSLCLLSTSLMAQKKDTVAQLFTLMGTGTVSYSESFVNAPNVSRSDKGVFTITGDSLTAIRLLWNEIKRRDSAAEVRYWDIYNEYKKCIRVIVEDQKFHKMLSNDIIRVQQQLKKIK